MSSRFAVLLATSLLLPAPVPAQDCGRASSPDQVTDLVWRVSGPFRLPPGEEAATVVVIGQEAIIDGTVKEQLLVVNGNARVNGTVLGNVAVVGGELQLGPRARVGRDLTLYRSTLRREPGAGIAGAVYRHAGVSFGQPALRLFWLAMTVMVVAAGLLFTMIGGRQLVEGAELLFSRPAAVLLTMAVLWLGVPLATVPVFATIVGIPIAVAILLFVLPALWVLGYVVTGRAIGRAMVRGSSAGETPLLEVAAGLLVLQAAGLVPAIGGVLVLIAGQAGAAALALRAWRVRADRRALTASPSLAGTA
ncbi:MAG TPA: polymer-forming cytoskeletal protein [Gemmatimonadales bacterium]|jgi:hypothetical protein|nr:polymer-forming cytoskeletal protein [Gemmatimonadales bacterium]